MCGICGVLNRNGEPAPARNVERMTRAIAHRGPDGEGVYVDGPFGLGHRRLAIIDLSPAGHQPMMSTDGRFVISYNGEVYNYRELRAELESRGHRFRSRSDTEVVLAALAEYGLNALERFNGMFALALWDRQRRELLLARDRYGIKPLYYAEAGGAVVFSSEIKAILAYGVIRPEIDLEGLAEYLAFQNFFTDRTLFRGVRTLPAGSYLRIGSGGTVSPPVPYWDFAFVEPEVIPDRQALTDELDHLFRQAVNRQLVSDVPVGAYLSGGMDTGAITAIAARQIPHLCSFTVGFDLTSASGLEMGFDERAPAEQMSYLFGTEHYEMVLKAGDMQRSMSALMWHLEEPRVGQSYPNFHAAKLASRFGKVVLAGTGGDELFGGYPWRYYRAAVNADFESYVGKYYQFWQRLVPAGQLSALLRPVLSEVGHVSARSIFESVFDRHSSTLATPEDYINHSLYFEAKTFLHGLLVLEDKLSMAHGLESRVPFLDNDLVDFAVRVPTRFKLGHLDEVIRLDENEPGSKTAKYFDKTRDGKLILREAMARYIPDPIVNGVKQGFSGPDASWFRGESIDYVRERLLEGRPRIFDFIDPSVARSLIADHLEGRANRRLLIWSLLCLEQWCELFVDGFSQRAAGWNAPSATALPGFGTEPVSLSATVA